MNNNDFQKHKTGDKVKWVLTLIAFILVGITFAGMILGYIKLPEVKREAKAETVAENSVGQVAATEISFYSGKARLLNSELRSGEPVCVSQTVTAIITPNTVSDKYVTWEIAWAPDAPLKDADISEYLEVTEESQGNLTATVNCYKAFRGSKAILTCTTRQGNKQGTCEVVYEGVPSSMSINSPTNAETFNLGKDTVDLLLVGQAYSLNLSLDNEFHDAGNGFDDYVVTISGVGTVTCGFFSRSARGAGWGSHDNVVSFDSIANEFVNVSVDNGTVSIDVTKSLYDYYESSSTHYVEGNGETTTYTNKLYSLNVDADGNLPYFIMTVRHRTLGYSAQYRFFITEEIESVRMNKQTITF